MADAEELFRKYHDRVFRYLYRASGQAETARDLTQDVFVRVSRSTVPAAADGELAAWLFRIARNIVLDHKRQVGRRMDAVPESLAHPDGVGRSASRDTTAAVNQALDALPDLDRDVFLLRETAGLGYEEIAALCDLTSDAVRNRIHRARLALRERLHAPIAARRIEPMRRKREGS